MVVTIGTMQLFHIQGTLVDLYAVRGFGRVLARSVPCNCFTYREHWWTFIAIGSFQAVEELVNYNWQLLQGRRLCSCNGHLPICQGRDLALWAGEGFSCEGREDGRGSLRGSPEVL